MKSFNTIVREQHLKLFKSTMDVVYGNVTLGTNFLKFISVFSDQQLFPDEDYVGIISLKRSVFRMFFRKKDKSN